jgi:hypothetical protein
MISRFVRAGLFGRSSTGCESLVGAEPSPSHATGAPDAGAQPFPKPQQPASISAATRNAMHCEIIVFASQRGNQRHEVAIRHQLAGTAPSGPSQKPSSARPTQLKANIEQTIAASDAQVAIAFTDRMTRSPCRQRSNFVRRILLNRGDNSPQ